VTEDRSRYRCSFCGQQQDDVDRLVAGPSAFICDGCVQGIAANFFGGSYWDSAKSTWVEHAPLSPWPHQRQSHFGDDVACSFCGKAEPDLQWLVGCREPNRFICDECVGLCVEIVCEPLAGPPANATAPTSKRSGGFRWPWQAPQMDRATRL
jgi:hypothetical protein